MRFLSLLFLMPALAGTGHLPFQGRWDLTIKTEKATFPSWIEVLDKDGQLQVLLQAREGSVHPAEAKIDSGHLIITTSRDTLWDLAIQGQSLTGEVKRGGVKSAGISGMKAPAMNRPEPKSWSKPQKLFNGKDLTGWAARNTTDNAKAKANAWKVENGVLINREQGFNLITTRKFDDFKLHIEYNIDEKGNSGIYLRGRYENQITAGPVRGLNGLASIYGRVAPTVEIPAKPGQWRSEDVMLVGRTVTIAIDGVTVIDHQEIRGITGGALDSDEDAPGPIYLQGDHTGGIRYRNIMIAVPKR
jgi:Domain of Unknown Function (DUF1080)